LSETVGFITEARKPEIFFITSVIALIAIYQLHQILTNNDRYVKKATDETARFGRRQSILLELSKQRGADLNEMLGVIIKADSIELAVDRVGVICH
jgi:predicted RND superfamily exporter protein